MKKKLTISSKNKVCCIKEKFKMWSFKKEENVENLIKDCNKLLTTKACPF